mgnify:CR=1 FL=1|tara:strand:- start:101 stop:358 length:258 start_codon:yes stop_codon:yes gene_type:complete
MKKIIYFIFGTFILVYLFQTLDKTCKRRSIFDKIKTPLLSSAIIGIIVSHITDEQPSCLQFVLPFSQPAPVTVDGQSIFTDLGNF